MEEIEERIGLFFVSNVYEVSFGYEIVTEFCIYKVYVRENQIEHIIKQDIEKIH